MKNSKRTVRYDRLIAAGAAAALFIILIVVIITIAAGLSRRKKEADQTDTKTSQTASSSGIQFEAVFMDYNEIHSGTILLVNNSHEYIFSESKSALLQNMDSQNDIHYKLRSLNMSMDKNALKALNTMLAAYYSETGDDSLMITEGYVSREQQDFMYNQALLNSISIASGGFSEHHTGLAFDYDISETAISVYKRKYQAASEWFEKNAAEYGFIIRYPDSKKNLTATGGHTNHLRYVGIPHAVYIRDHNITLEEYTESLKGYLYGERSLNISHGPKEYSVYFIKASPDVQDTEVYVPRSGTVSYTVSGNNEDGFIVTIEKK